MRQRGPRAVATVRADGTGEVSIGRRTIPLKGADVAEAGAIVVELLAARAAQRGRPIRMMARSPAGCRLVVVHPDGSLGDDSSLTHRPGPFRLAVATAVVAAVAIGGWVFVRVAASARTGPESVPSVSLSAGQSLPAGAASASQGVPSGSPGTPGRSGERDDAERGQSSQSSSPSPNGSARTGLGNSPLTPTAGPDPGGADPALSPDAAAPAPKSGPPPDGVGDPPGDPGSPSDGPEPDPASPPAGTDMETRPKADPPTGTTPRVRGSGKPRPPAARSSSEGFMLWQDE
ncbi:MAG: hypothetical protein LBJ08_04815 [Bifidobacteriaceae bacterium]|jgi:hypothetical protein|nr:hypothetical protein [Bifidobacteriaceae bacterium]